MRAHVVGLILAIVTPLLIFSGFLVLRSASHEQVILESTVRARTREAAVTLEHDLYSLRTKLFLLAGSRDLLADDFDAFRTNASTFGDSLRLVLRDPMGRPIVSTDPSPNPGHVAAEPDLDSIRRVVGTGLPDVSNLTRDAESGSLSIAINVPVLRDARVAYVLSLDVAPLLPQMLDELDLEPQWLVTISDRAGRTIARSRDPERFVGEMGRSAVLAQFRAAEQGWFPLTSRDGVPLYNAFARVPISGWVVAVGIPNDVLFAPVRRSTLLLALLGGGTLAVALLLGSLIGGRIAGGITKLVGYAEAVGRGERIALRSTGLHEADAVARALDEANEQLLRGAKERAVLLQRTLTAQEAERRRIARELHDSIGQYLTALRLGLKAIEPTQAGETSATERLTELKRLATDAGRELTRIAWELRPMALDDLGLRGAVTQYLEEWAERSQLPIDLEINLGDRRLPQVIETTLFRVLQETVVNVLKHAGASRIGVILNAGADAIRLIVEDDGRGFDHPDPGGGQVSSMTRFGLLGVRERLALIGGSLEIESGERTGTTVYVQIPLTAACGGGGV